MLGAYIYIYDIGINCSTCYVTYKRLHIIHGNHICIYILMTYIYILIFFVLCHLYGYLSAGMGIESFVSDFLLLFFPPEYGWVKKLFLQYTFHGCECLNDCDI